MNVHFFKIRRWIGFVAARYVSRRRGSSPSTILSVLGIATGVLALVVIIAVMNGFQLGFIESILEISSYHVRLQGPSPSELDSLGRDISSLPGVGSAIPFRELHVLLRGRHTNPRGALLRALPPDALSLDPGLASRLEMEGGSFDLRARNSIVLGAELARHLFVRVGDEIHLLSITGGLGNQEEEGSDLFVVTGIFRSHFYEYDLGWAFINMETGAALSGENFGPLLGVKLENRWQDRRALELMGALLSSRGYSEADYKLSSWRDYNRAFFSALRTEKLMMFILVGLIFIVVGLNIYQAQRRIVLERREEIGLLRALGASELSVRLVFVVDGFIIGLSGAGMGLGLGLLLSYRIQSFFQAMEALVNSFIGLLNSLFHSLGVQGAGGEFAVFSPQIFYITEIPSRVIPREAFFIFLFGFLSALLASWFASRRVSVLKPAEVLRYE
ncbi:MAG: ABC transporter permease [Treponema sp.]|nr:ABC transporter permease [Treponema sp.]